MSANLEIVNTIKNRKVDPQGLSAVFADRISFKSKNPKWQNFPASVMPLGFVEDYERIKKFKVYEDDVWLIGYPRSGTTVMQEMIWLLLNKFDFEGATKADTYNRAQWFDLFNLVHQIQEVSIDHCEKMPRPRVFKTHSPVEYLPDELWTVKPKIIHIERDIKDVAISLYYLRKDTFHDDVGPIEEHFEDILNDRTWWCPYREHVLNYKNIPDYEKILYLTYEEFSADKAAITKKTADFLGVEYTQKNIDDMVAHLDVKKMKKSKATNMQHFMEKFNAISKDDKPTDQFIRKGIVGDHKNQMSDETIKRFNEWYAEIKNMKSSW